MQLNDNAAILPQKYMGTKLVEAAPALGANGEEGYRVTYDNGHVSWSPLAEFQKAYVRTDRLDFGRAFEAMRLGFHVRRTSWEATSFVQIETQEKRTPKSFVIIQLVWSGRMKSFEWQPSQQDLLAEDWKILVPHQLVQQGSSLK